MLKNAIILFLVYSFITHASFTSNQTISSDLIQVHAKDLRIQKKRESWLFSRIMRSSERTRITRYKSCPRHIARASADLPMSDTSLKFPRFHDTLNK